MIIDPLTGRCLFQDPATGSGFLIGQNPGVPPGTPGINLFPILPPAQPVNPPGADFVVF